jgi:AbrB family looped-hinge helix DNA binding protein
MEIPATVSSKGQITIPAEVRKALRLRAGDRVIFRVVDGHTVFQPESVGASESQTAVELEKVPDFFSLAGSVPVPAGIDAADWPSQRAAAWAASVAGTM